MRRTIDRDIVMLRIERMPFWQVAFVLAGALAAVLALAVVVSALFLVLLPVILVGAVAVRVLARRGPGAARREREVIEAEYEVVADDRAGERTQSGDSTRDK